MTHEPDPDPTDEYEPVEYQATGTVHRIFGICEDCGREVGVISSDDGTPSLREHLLPTPDRSNLTRMRCPCVSGEITIIFIKN